VYGLAQMCWLAAVYRSSQLTWKRAVEFTEVAQPEPRSLVERMGRKACPISDDYYRIIDCASATLRAGRKLSGVTVRIAVPRYR
jgi:hypothetical protein